MLLDDLETPRAKHGALASPNPPPGAAEDWTVPQQWERLTAEEHRVWDTLFARQQTLLPGCAVDAFMEGIDILGMERPGIPDLADLNARLSAHTGWSVVSVPGLVPDDVFFRHLSERRFPAGNFIRAMDQLDYLEEPDVFHDVFGHVPLLADPPVADFMQALGKLGLGAVGTPALARVSRLYWYTVEFGLTRQGGGLRIYGAGILSSFGETHYALESDIPHRLRFDLERVLRTRYRSDAMQRSYFVIDRFEDVLGLVGGGNFEELCAKVAPLPDFSPDDAAREELAA